MQSKPRAITRWPRPSVGGRADWGVAVEWIARRAGLGFLPLGREQYDSAIPQSRPGRPGAAAFREALAKEDMQEELLEMG